MVTNAAAIGAAAGAAAGEVASEAARKVNATNYFAPDQGLTDSVQAQKDALLKLMAVHGEDAQQVWEDARQRAGERRSEAIPPELYAEASQAYTDRLGEYNRLLDQAVVEAQSQTSRRAAAEAVYKDLVAGDRALLEQYAADDITAAGRGGGGGGGGRGGRGGSKGYTPGFAPGALGDATLPADFFLQQLGPDPEGFNALNADQHLGVPFRAGVSASGRINSRSGFQGLAATASNALRTANPLSGFRGLTNIGRPGSSSSRKPSPAVKVAAKLAKPSAANSGSRGGSIAYARSTRRMN